jgi:hypothetical protein
LPFLRKSGEAKDDEGDCAKDLWVIEPAFGHSPCVYGIEWNNARVRIRHMGQVGICPLISLRIFQCRRSVPINNSGSRCPKLSTSFEDKLLEATLTSYGTRSRVLPRSRAGVPNSLSRFAGSI